MIQTPWMEASEAGYKNRAKTRAIKKRIFVSKVSCTKFKKLRFALPLNQRNQALTEKRDAIKLIDHAVKRGL